jgi:hypothetical protein
MSEEMFNAEKLYRATMTIAKSMLTKGLITAEEYTIIDTKMLEKISPNIRHVISPHFLDFIGF